MLFNDQQFFALLPPFFMVASVTKAGEVVLVLIRLVFEELDSLEDLFGNRKVLPIGFDSWQSRWS